MEIINLFDGPNGLMAAKLKNCQICGKVFMSTGGKVCPACLDKQADDEMKVIEYVRDHPKCKVMEIIEATEVAEPIIRRLIEEGRFIQEGVDYSYPCKKCGQLIMKGKFCEKCMAEMQEELKGVHSKIAEQREADRGHGMYSKDLKKPIAK